MSEHLCLLCNRDLTEISDRTNEGFWAVTIEDSCNPGVARAHPVHTKCIQENYAEEFELVRRQLTEKGSTA